MQTIYKNENERSNSRIISTVGVILCTKRIGRYMKGEHHRRFRKRIVEL